jgi:FKBP-type peptidyl-prolyl cis-trans isomerase 2
LGHEFYNSQTDGEKVFVAGRGHEVMGLDEGVVGLRKGAKATLLLLPDKAYGLIGDEKKINGRIILRYDIEVKDVR